ncbi:MAG: hypothetical protein L3J93_04635 [Thermoplasmata archaeon]|nr:hypothetical protein [Thermoplasmata archaeon]
MLEARRLGARPLLLLEDEASYWAAVERMPAALRASRPGEHEWAAIAKADALLYFPGPANRSKMHALPGALQRTILEHNPEWLRRMRSARVRAARSVLGYASESQAAFWNTPLDEWRRALERGTVHADLKAIAATALRIASRLKRGRLLRITASNGTDVTLRLRRRQPVVDDGVVTPSDVNSGRNLTVSPPGTVVVAIDEKGAAGTAVANRPSFLTDGRSEGGEWEMTGGRLLQSRYTAGQAEFDRSFQEAPAGRNVVSIFALGLNPALGPGVPQVEDQESGAVTLGLGGNDAYGGANRCPFVSWIVIGDASVALDGKPLCDRGQLL